MGAIPSIGEAGFPSSDAREEDRIDNWRESPKLRNEKRPFHFAPVVNERIIANSLRENSGAWDQFAGWAVVKRAEVGGTRRCRLLY